MINNLIIQVHKLFPNKTTTSQIMIYINISNSLISTHITYLKTIKN